MRRRHAPSARVRRCHRYDNGRAAGTWSCADPALRQANGVRNAVRVAVADLNSSAVLSPANRAEHYAESFLRRKAALYNRSTFCVVPPGDSAITPRVSSFVAALCVPVRRDSKRLVIHLALTRT